MSEITHELRQVLMSHIRIQPENMSLMLIDEVERLEREVADLRETISNQHQRHDNQIADLRKHIDQLKGVHGA